MFKGRSISNFNDLLDSFLNTESSYIRVFFSHKTHIITPLSAFTENVTKYYLPVPVLEGEYVVLHSM